ncbi:YdeI/OmpD-associated family protein [Paenibacillus bovis]|uniref:Thymidylate synthase n=1 Tax=Paenibacillus bovis TaxID=1616788 RepID=A0A172ZGE1_9BACL|nr:thymidylate synthase [Paenibacillus bovis]ANF96668.1 thymidylate synthase [Paenibacillus bovis]
MEIENLIMVCTRAEWRNWLEENSQTARCCWVMISITPSADTVLYLDAVEEALCFGWIDGIKKKISDHRLAQRFSPRSSTSSWTELNKERVRRLEKLGLMKEEGRKVLPDMNPASFHIHELIGQRLREEDQVYANFIAFPSLYCHIRIDTIQRYVHQPLVFQKRLNKFITCTKDNKMYGQWNDQGRLLHY